MLHDMQKPRRDNLNSLTGVSFGRCWFYMGDKHVRDETVVAIFLCVCVHKALLTSVDTKILV